MSLGHERYRLFSRRALILGSLQAGCMAILGGRMVQLQILQRDNLSSMAEENRISHRLLAPIRGRILDREGRILAGNTDNYQVVLIPELAENLYEVLDDFNMILPLDPARRALIEREIKEKPKFVPVVLRDNLSWEELAQLEVHAPNLSGVQVDRTRRRNYPFGQSAAHITGYVGPVSEKELKQDTSNNPVMRIPEFRIGKAGLEKTEELLIRGEPGNKSLEVDAHGRVKKLLSQNDGIAGVDFISSIDAELQAFAFRRLGEESGSVVVIDTFTGEILALTTAPCYDPAAFHFGIPSNLWRELNANPKTPLLNKPIAGQYVPGSTFKMTTALAALRSGIDPEMSVFCNSKYALGNHIFHCWKKEGHGRMNLHSGLAHSCDVYFYEISRRIGVDAIAEAAYILGLGQRTGISISGEKPGLIPTEAWHRRRFRAPWTTGLSLNAGIGQGYVLTTPLQLAVMAARLASGRNVLPSLTKLERTDQTKFDLLPIDPRHLRMIQDAMYTVVNVAGGTAYGARIKDGSFPMAGKTGTAQVRRITMEERSGAGGVRKNETLPWHLRDHALFVAYAPADAPRYAISVIVEHGGSGSKMAAPIAADVLGFLYQKQQKT